MFTTEVNAGNCGMMTVINAFPSEDKQRITLEIASECPNVQEGANELGELEAVNEVFGSAFDTKVFQTMAKHIKHPGCPVVSAILKTIEAAVGLAMPSDISIKIRQS